MEQELKKIIANYKHPEINENFISEKNIKIDKINDKYKIDIEINFFDNFNHNKIREDLIKHLKNSLNLDVEINLTFKIKSHEVQNNLTPMHGVKNIIAIASGKGGVGKSSVTTNLACGLSKLGARVGILDADIYGPSQPQMFGIHQKPESKDGKSMEPLNSNNIQIMSIGFLVDQETPMIWRGPMVTGTLEQLLKETNWDTLDYLLIDLPPGTGDIQLTLAQKIPLTGAIIVTTPQDIALLDARRGLRMFEKVKVPILGIVENMSTHVCSNCGHEESIFGKDGGKQMANDYAVDLLGSLPLDINIREKLDQGKPFDLHEDPKSTFGNIFRQVSLKTSFKIGMLNQDRQSKFPKIVIEKS
jgi:ATP-binding protein involved in chromosome partitioning